jgi:hypothetical protein
MFFASCAATGGSATTGSPPDEFGTVTVPFGLAAAGSASAARTTKARTKKIFSVRIDSETPSR